MKTPFEHIAEAANRAVEIAAAMLFFGLVYFVVTAS
jgi:hypothetical protein